MANTLQGLATKVLILFTLVLALYYFDIPVWSAEFRLPNVQVSFLLALSIFTLGILIKRRAIQVSFETSEIGFGRGIFLLVASAFLYVYGSYSTVAAWFHYESLLLLVVGYIVLRVGTAVIRFLAPLLLVLAFAFVPFGALPLSVSSGLILLLALWDGLAFLFFAGARGKPLVLLACLILISLVAWVGAVDENLAYLPYLVPVPLLFLAIPRARRFIELPSGQADFACSSHDPMPSGFCAFCGKKVSRSITPENLGGWGLIAVCAVVLMLVISSVPMLAISGGPYQAVYTARGPVLTQVPITPTGWQANSTVLNYWSQTNETFETIRVYVPVSQPEVKNYTVYYSVSSSPNILNAPSGNASGWKWISSAFTPLAGFQGRLSTYTQGNTTMLSYGGSRTMTFLGDSGFLTKYVTVGFVREFKNSNAGADTAQFLADLNAVWLPGLSTDSFYSDWTLFVSNMVSNLAVLLPYVEVLVSLSLIGWIAYRVTTSEESLDKFYTAAVLTKERSWSILLELLKTPKKARPGYELSGSQGEIPKVQVEDSLKILTSDGLVKPELVSTGDEIRLFWKART